MPPTTLQDFKESITLHPALLRPGETVDIQLTSQQEYVPLTIEVIVHYLEEEFTVGEGIRVVWDTSGPLKTVSIHHAFVMRRTVHVAANILC